ncbi:AlpA family transcriptional regulator [Pseudoduganella lurida]|uniref:AlpA family transcriptional regulator n=1 Tax=Pseudoduganella lurida TaxID=1036180 RepID=A0A562RLH5_9BURK|nr:AlpA family phage regulatory protein [Pseudoduganella lurida]TWI69306.1 AlpA family transcriptional regulator [Pseudoduganella lurida]
MSTTQERRTIPRTTELSLVKLPAVMAICGMSRSSVYLAIKQGDFPAPIAVGGRARAWIRHEVENWIGTRVRATRVTRTGPVTSTSAQPPAKRKRSGPTRMP